ncbi:MAG: hypothetical protein Q9163_000872 [Psora crenata]
MPTEKRTGEKRTLENLTEQKSTEKALAFALHEEAVSRIVWDGKSPNWYAYDVGPRSPDVIFVDALYHCDRHKEGLLLARAKKAPSTVYSQRMAAQGEAAADEEEER